MEYFKLKLDRRSIDHRRPSINVRSLLPSTKCVTKETISQRAKSEPFRAKMRNTPTCSPILPSIYLVTNSLYFYVKRRKYAALMRWLSIPLFEMGLGKPTLTLYEPGGFKNTRYINSVDIELRIAFSCQISTGKWKCVNPCLDFLGIPDQRTAYLKRRRAGSATEDGRPCVDQVLPPTW